MQNKLQKKPRGARLTSIEIILSEPLKTSVFRGNFENAMFFVALL